MRLPETGFGQDDAASLAMTLVRTFGSGALMLVEEQLETCADHADLQARWCEVRDALVVLGEANMCMTAALDLLDQIEEISVPPMLDHAIEQLGLRDGGSQAVDPSVTVTTCSKAFYEEKVQRYLAQAQCCSDLDEKTKQLNTASHYATIRERFDDLQSGK